MGVANFFYLCRIKVKICIMYMPDNPAKNAEHQAILNFCWIIGVWIIFKIFFKIFRQYLHFCEREDVYHRHYTLGQTNTWTDQQRDNRCIPNLIGQEYCIRSLKVAFERIRFWQENKIVILFNIE